jgi:mycofactocin system FadH/OYE family oxidoreductase 2
MFDTLFTPLTLGRTALSNRIAFMAHRTNFARHSRVDARHLAYYGRRAAGGCGLIVVGEFSIHANDRPFEAMIDLTLPDADRDLQRLTGAVHDHGRPVFAQLNHHGFQSSGAITRCAVWGPSAVADIVFGETAKPMECEEIAELIQAFAAAAQKTRAAGFDGVELDMGPFSLLRQFLSPISNHRSDDYGGSPENRLRLPLEVLAAVRTSVGKDFTVGIRLCMDEQFWGGIGPDDGLHFAKAFEATGAVDYFSPCIGTYYNLHLANGSMHVPQESVAGLCARLKTELQVPVIAGHQVGTVQAAEALLAAGQADAAGFVRALIAEPDLPQKARSGRSEAIRPCLRDNKGCIGRINQQKPLSCIHNPQVGFEARPAAAACAKPKKVMVVGAGPAGLEAARAAAQRGHYVTVYEQRQAIGGQVRLHQLAAGREPIFAAIGYLQHALGELKVTIVTGTEVTAELIRKNRPDAVVIATGSRPIAQPYAGSYGPPAVIDVWQVLQNDHPVGEKVLFIDEVGSHYAAAVAERLAGQGKKIDLVTCDLFVGFELAPLGDLYLSRQRLLQKGVSFKSDLAVERIEGGCVFTKNIYTNAQITFEGYDTIVVAAGACAAEKLYHELAGTVDELYRCGDCVAPRGMDMAIFEGRAVGELL